MDKDYLEDYEKKEQEEYQRFLHKFPNGTFSIEKDRYPSKERFFKLAEPVAIFPPLCTETNNVWAEVPFSGSLVVQIAPVVKEEFEKTYFEVSKIPEVIEFIKETGRLQIAFNFMATSYEGLDYLDPFFKELRPPCLYLAPPDILGSKKEIDNAAAAFSSLGQIRYASYMLDRYMPMTSKQGVLNMVNNSGYAYVFLKLCHHPIAEYIECLLIDDPWAADMALGICKNFITDPARNIFSGLLNYTREAINLSQVLPPCDRPKKIRFPCEIGKFLMSKLTYAPKGLDACKELIYHYDAYDLQKVQKAMNEGITTNQPDIINKNATELFEILDNIWEDKTLPRRIKGLQIGIPLSMAVIGSAAAGPIGAVGGFLAGLGYNVVDKSIDLVTEGLSERLAKLKTKSYQANIYDFKQKYKNRIVLNSAKELPS